VAVENYKAFSALKGKGRDEVREKISRNWGRRPTNPGFKKSSGNSLSSSNKTDSKKKVAKGAEEYFSRGVRERGPKAKERDNREEESDNK